MLVGASVPCTDNFCQRCGKAVGSDASFCSTCGFKIPSVPSPLSRPWPTSNRNSSQTTIAALEKMVVEHPDDESYRKLLALQLYADAGETWWEDPKEKIRYCTSFEQIQHARRQLTRALEIQFDDPHLRNELIKELQLVNSLEDREYTGNWFMIVLLGFFYVIPGALWWYVNRRPRYLINRDYVAHRQTGRHVNPAVKMGGLLGEIGGWVERNTGEWGGWIAIFVMFFVGVCLSPLFIILAYKQNYLDVPEVSAQVGMISAAALAAPSAPRNVKCAKCGQEWQADARFCTACGTALSIRNKGPNETALDKLIMSLELALQHADTARVRMVVLDSLNADPELRHAAIASVIAMCCYAQSGNFHEAFVQLVNARNFYADHLKLPKNQRDIFSKKGLLIGDLQPIGDRALQEEPWLYLLLGGFDSPRHPGVYRGDSDAEKQQAAVRAWSNFLDLNREVFTCILGYLYFTNRQYAEAAKNLLNGLLLARKYEAAQPVRIELLWPRVLLGDCYWEGGQHDEAIAVWRSARSFELCCQLDSDVDNWGHLALPYIAKAKSRLVERKVPLPSWDSSRDASRQLNECWKHITTAVSVVAGDDLEQGVESVRQAGYSYAIAIERAAAVMKTVEHLDPFIWTRITTEDSSFWTRRECAQGLLLEMQALLHLATNRPILAIADYKQAVGIWPTLSRYAALGALQEAGGLLTDARTTYETCLTCAEEFGSLASEDERESILPRIREGLRSLRSQI